MWLWKKNDSYPIFCPVYTEYFVFMGSQIVQRSLTAVREEYADFLREKHRNDTTWKCLHKWHFNTVRTQIKLELKHSLTSKKLSEEKMHLCGSQTFWCPTILPDCPESPRAAGAHVKGPTLPQWPSQCGRSGTAAPVSHLGRTGDGSGGNTDQLCLGRGRCYLWCEGPTT